MGSLHKSRDAVVLVLPARSVVSVPVWVESRDPAIVQEMARLKIEMMGLVSSERVTEDAGIDLLAVVDDRTLVRASVFPPDLPVSAAHLTGDSYVPSPLALALESDAIHIWNEFGDTVAAVCRGSEVICWETNHAQTKDELGVWIRCLLAELDAGGFLPSAASIVDWSGLITGDLGLPRLPVPPSARIDGPPIAEKQPTAGWKPLTRRKEEDSRRRRSLFAAAATLTGGLLAAGVIGAMAWSWLLDFRLHHLRAEYAAKREATRPLRESANRWMRVERAVAPDFFPLEILHAVSKCLPSGGAKLTVFEITDAREPGGQSEGARSEDSMAQAAAFSVRLQGQAQNASLATKFLNNLSANMKDVDWRMATPSFQPDNTASFVIECKRNGTQTH
ncbi:MAG TPA: hypothetical protein VIS96_15080 [Terrimicrobiaceae bacterium]